MAKGPSGALGVDPPYPRILEPPEPRHPMHLQGESRGEIELGVVPALG